MDQWNQPFQKDYGQTCKMADGDNSAQILTRRKVPPGAEKAFYPGIVITDKKTNIGAYCGKKSVMNIVFIMS